MDTLVPPPDRPTPDVRDSVFPSAVHVTRGASYLALQNIAMSAVSIVSFAILARLITPTDVGIWTMLLFVISVCQMATLSMPSAATKFVSDSVSRGDRKAAASVFYQAIRVSLVIYGILGVVIFLGAGFLASLLLGGSSYEILFQVEALDIVIFLGAIPVLTYTLFGLEKFKEVAIIGLIMSTVLRQALIIGLVILFKGLIGLVIGWVISDLAAAVAYLVYVLRALGAPRFDFSLRRLLTFSVPLSIGNFATFAQSWFDRALLAAFVPLTTLGIYSAMITGYGVLAGISGAMTTTLFPAYSALQATDQRQMRSNAVRLASRYASFVLLPLALGLLATAKPALTLFVGEAYVGGTEPLMILSAIFALTALATTPLSPMLIAIEETAKASAITICSVGISLVAAFFLLPLYGMIGAAEARGLTLIVGALLTIIVLRRKMHLQLDLEAMAKSLVAAGVMAVVVIAVQIPLYSKFLLPVYVTVGLIAYLMMLRVLNAVQQDDMDLIRSYLGNRLVYATNVLGKILLSEAKEHALA